MNNNNEPTDNRVVINVGGRRFETTRSTITNSYSRFLCKELAKGGSEIFVDRSGKAFEHVIAYMRDNDYSFPDRYLDEIDFYGLARPLNVRQADYIEKNFNIVNQNIASSRALLVKMLTLIFQGIIKNLNIVNENVSSSARNIVLYHMLNNSTTSNDQPSPTPPNNNQSPSTSNEQPSENNAINLNDLLREFLSCPHNENNNSSSSSSNISSPSESNINNAPSSNINSSRPTNTPTSSNDFNDKLDSLLERAVDLLASVMNPNTPAIPTSTTNDVIDKLGNLLNTMSDKQPPTKDRSEDKQA